MAQDTLDAEITNRVSTSDKMFVLKRVINAPVSVVYRAWSDAKQLAMWFGPHRFTNPVCEVDFRVGGAFRLVMRSPEGEDYPIKGVFTEIVPNQKIQYIENWEEHGEQWLGMLRALSGEENPSNEAVQTVFFEAQNGKTLVTIQAEFATAAVCRAMSNMGMSEGWLQSFERLDGLAITNASENEIVITRIVDAPREIVYKAFTDKKKIDSWWGPRGFKNETHERDVRVGGKWSYIMHGPDGVDYDNLVQYTELESPRYIAYLHGTHEQPDMFHAEIILDAIGSKTQITLRMTFISGEVRDKMIAEVGAIEGGNQTLDRLDSHLFTTLKIEIVSDTEVVLKRGFLAQRNLVFEALSRAEHFPYWWGPRCMNMDSCTLDSKPGGAYQFVLSDTNGNESRWKGTIRELDGPEHMVFTESFDLPGMGWTPETVITVKLEDFWGMTVYTAHMKYASKEMRDGHLGSGFEEGASESYDRLQELTGEMLFVTREFNAPRDVVWKAYTDPEVFRKWFGPKGFDMHSCTIDLRPGGICLYGLRSNTGNEMWGKFTYIDIAAPYRLVYKNSFANEFGETIHHPMAAGWPLEMFNTMLFTENSGKTTITLIGTSYNGTAEEREEYKNGIASMNGGWKGTFDKLDELLTTDH